MILKAGISPAKKLYAHLSEEGMDGGREVVEPENFPLLTPMLVMGFESFKKQGRLLRSDEAQVQELLVHFAASAGHKAVFISHRWWRTDVGHPDYTEGEKANLKFHTVVHGVELLIDKRGLDRCVVGC